VSDAPPAGRGTPDDAPEDGPQTDGPLGDPLLSVRELRTHFHTDEGTLKAVDGVSFDVYPGETVCLVGESGSGKTVACESLTKLVPTPPGEIVGGRILFEGGDLASLSEKQLRKYRGGRIAHVFQNPQGALDPVYTIGAQVAEAVRLHQDASQRTAHEHAVELLDRVGIPDAAERADEYPHEFSGGMKQRVVIAVALAADPDLLVADEPTTALDVTTQAGILDLLNELKDERDMAILFVTHDLGVVARMADRVIVLYAGKVMERGGVLSVFGEPAHPYTQALFRCLPSRGGMEAIGGAIPDPTDPPAGCRFHPRCPHAIEECRAGEQPALEAVGGAGGDGSVGGRNHDSGDREGESYERGTGQDSRTAHEAACVFYRDDHDASVVRDGAGLRSANQGSELGSEPEQEAERTDRGGR
jgi:peptide/nickel transport system ATP-binding protein